jgi:hypothetical protein
MPVPKLSREQRSLGGKISGMMRRASAAARARGPKARLRELENAVWEVANTAEGKKFKDPLRQVLMAFKKSDPCAFVSGLLTKLFLRRRR